MDAIEHIKKTIDVISLFELRNNALKEDLDFFNKFNDISMHLGALIRLNHEVMYLCVDTYSLHEGISKNKSLYSKIIKNNGAVLSRVDKSEDHKTERIIFLPCISPSGNRELAPEEKDKAAKIINEQGLKSREKIQKNSGIKSSKHSDLDQWLKDVQDEAPISKLGDFRKEFAHRLDTLHNICRELELPVFEELANRISVISSVLTTYKIRLQDILNYTASNHYEGVVGINYDSISRLKQYIELEPIIEKGMKSPLT
jgi:hypothetical protein